MMKHVDHDDQVGLCRNARVGRFTLDSRQVGQTFASGAQGQVLDHVGFGIDGAAAALTHCG